MAHRVGVDQVTTVEVDPGVAATAARNLKMAGYPITVADRFGISVSPDGQSVWLDDPSQPVGDAAHVTTDAVPGRRAPHVWLPEGHSTLDLFGTWFRLLTDPQLLLTHDRASASLSRRLFFSNTPSRLRSASG